MACIVVTPPSPLPQPPNQFLNEHLAMFEPESAKIAPASYIYCNLLTRPLKTTPAKVIKCVMKNNTGLSRCYAAL
jgi:hypothetical protein